MTDNTTSPSSLGAGQQAPNDSSSEENKIAFAVRRMLAQLDTMKPVKVNAVYPGEGTPPGPGTVDVELLISQIDGNGNAVGSGVVYGIPVARMKGGVWTVICDPAVGDIGFVMAADRDMTKVIGSSGKVSPPGTLRKMSISDGIYVAGFLNTVGDNYLWLKTDGTFKLAAAGGFVLETETNGSATITGDLNVTGNIKASADVWASAGSPATKVTLLGHISVNSTTPPTPGH